MAKLLYNDSAYENTAAKWATDTRIYPANSLLIESDTGILKKGDGINAYADLATIGARQALTWADVTGKPSTFAPEIGTTATKAAAGNHDHAVEADVDSGLAAASTIQALAIALSGKILAHDHAVAADATSGLAEASTIQALAIALSTRIKALEDLASDTSE